jgi:hypothetical protein
LSEHVAGAATRSRPGRARHITWSARYAILAGTLVVLLSVTIFERFGITVGKNAIDCSLLALGFFVVLGLSFDCFELSATRVAVYGAIVVAALLSYWFNRKAGDALSVPSLVLYLVLYAPFMFSLRPGIVAADGRQLMSQFLAVSLVCAVAGIVQFYLQFAIHSEWLFDYTYLIPEVLRGNTNYNTVYNVGFFTKSNGFFLREPSEFSFLMALALIVEWSGKRRVWLLACFGMGLVLSYSGTGVLTLGVALLVPFDYKVCIRLLGAVALAVLLFFALRDALKLDLIMRRVNEFGSEKSSGYMRYIAPALLVNDSFADTGWSPFFGHGPGLISRAAVHYRAHDPTWAKSVFEYGAVGFVLVCSLFASALSRPQVPLRLRVVLFVTWLVTGGLLLTAPAVALRLCLVGFLPDVSRRDAAEAGGAGP